MYSTTALLSYIIGNFEAGKKDINLLKLQKDSKNIFGVDEILFYEIISKISKEGLIEIKNKIVVNVDSYLLQKYILTIKNILHADSSFHIDLSIQALECLDILIHCSISRGLRTHRSIRVTIEAKNSALEKKFLMLCDKNTQQELIDNGLIEMMKEIKTGAINVELIFNKEKADKLIEFNKIINFFN